jgi:hypothetical protein
VGVDRKTVATHAPWLAVAVIVLALLAEACSRRTPTPLSADAAADRFSAGRALVVLERLLGDGAPHPVGSEADARVRERIEAELRALGLVPERQATFVCRGRVCAPVVNVLARIPGDLAQPSVLLLSHYDSVHAGPGAGDDMHGVAVMLEVARAMVAEPARRHPVLLLFDEGEEVGLLGAKAFAGEHPAAAEIGVAVNIEARGTEGRTSMFETAADNATLIERYARAVPDPEATSLAVEVYRRMPNDTDFTVLRRSGIVGLNLAFIGGVARYHTPLDDLAHLDAGSVQHQGDTVLALARDLAAAIPAREPGDAAFTDLLGLVMVVWPSAWSVPLLLAVGLALLAAGVVARRQGRVGARGLALGLLCAIATLVVATAVGWGLASAVAATHGVGLAALAQPLPMRVAAWSAVAAATAATAHVVARRVRPVESALATWLMWIAIGVATTLAAPGAAPPFVLALVPGGVAVAIALVRPQRELAALAAALAAFALPWAALAFALEDAFGWSMAAAVLLPMSAIASTASWALAGDAVAAARRRLIVAGSALALAAAAAAMAVDVHDDDAPRRLTLVHYENRDRGEASILLAPGDAPLPDALREAGGFDEPARAALPWMNAPMWSAATVASDAAAPRLAIAKSEPAADGRRIVAHLDAAAGSDRATLHAPSRAPIRSLRVAGVPVALEGDGPFALHVFGLPTAGVDIELEVAGPTPLELAVVACSRGVPETELARERDRWGVPAQWGDASCIATNARL